MRSFQHLPAAARVARPWKNGGGTMTDVLVSPPGARLDAFEWRISIARVEGSGPFSMFPGIDRSMAILEGAGLTLEIAGAAPATLTERSPPLAFAGDVATSARLIGGPVTDLNVMTHRGRVAHRMQRLDLSPGLPLTRDLAQAVLVWGDGTGSIAAPDGIVHPALHDALWIEAPARVTMAAVTPATAYLIELLGPAA